MTSTIFVDKQTVVQADWLNDVNTKTYADTADTVGYMPAGVGAVATDVQTVLREAISVTRFGIHPGIAYKSTNCTQYALLATYVNARGGNIQIDWPSSTEKYYFSPKSNATFSGGAAYAWRGAAEFVDVDNCYHVGNGVIVHLEADASWHRGNSLPVAGLDESVFQFRATAAGMCDRVGVIGIKSTTDATIADPTSGHADGASFGIAYRGCNNTYTENPVCNYWGTDGIYYGDGYGAGFGGSNHTLINPQCDHNYRQGISVVRNDNGQIFGGMLSNTAGGSFGHGIDFEPNGSNTQKGWTLYGTKTKDNQRGACNFINTSNVTWINPDIDEQHASTSGAIYIDGSNVVGYNVKGIQFIGGEIKSTQPLVYATGSVSSVGGIDEILFTGGIRLSCVGSTPSGNAWLRVNASGNTGAQIGSFTFDNVVIEGNGGFTFKSDGTNVAKFTIRNSKWTLTNPNAAALAFTIATASALDVVDLDNVEMTIASGKTMATNTPYIISGSLKNCKLSGQSGAIIQWQDYGAGRSSFVIGTNTFSAYNFYKGITTNLDMKVAGTVEQQISGDYGLPGRIVHGGRQRLVGYLAAPASFTNRQAPLDGDICRNVGNSGSGISEVEYTYDGNAARWRLSKSVIKKGVTASRPTPSGAIAAVLEGIPYMDTTLAANGKPIWWNGSAWVDSTGASI